MPRTPDRTPGPAIEEELQLEDNGVDPSQVGAITLNAGALKAQDSVGVFDLRSGSGLSEAGHEVLDTLVHRIAENAFVQVVRNAQNRVTDIITWTNSGMTVKIRETNITRAANKVSSTVEKQYDGAGVIITGQTLTSTLARDAAGRVTDFTLVET